MDQLNKDMNEAFKLDKAPIIEAVVDVDCDMPSGFDLVAWEQRVRDQFRATYPKFRQQFIEEHKIEAQPDAPPKVSSKHSVQAFQLLHDDEKQLVQIRSQGFSFNRLAPYSSLDDYLSEIERTWRLFLELTAPIQLRAVRLRYINRILMPLTDGKLKLSDFLKNSPQLPNQSNLTFAGFLHQYVAVEAGTGHQANIVLTAQQRENDHLPVIFDICVAAAQAKDPQNWTWILEKIQSLRGLKNRIFRNTLTEQCLNLFQHSEFAASQGTQP